MTDNSQHGPSGFAGLFLAKLPIDGSALGNSTLRKELRWPESRYWEIRDDLLRQGLIQRGRGRGGSVRLSSARPPNLSEVTTIKQPGLSIVGALSTYPDAALDRLARDKVDEVSNLRFPREVLIREIATALSSLSYVAKVLAPSRPPTYACLKLLMDASELQLPVNGFRRLVLAETDALTKRADDEKALPANKSYQLYRRMLFAAWEDDGRVDRSEALLLAALRTELGIWTREHLLLEHHSDVRPIWDSPTCYEEALKLLLSTGLIVIHEDFYALPQEVGSQIRRVWGIDLEDSAYEALLLNLRGRHLRRALEAAKLPLSGSKEERAERLIQSLVPPAEVLETLHILELKQLCRDLSLPSSGLKKDLISSVIDYFDTGLHLAQITGVPDPRPVLPAEPEPRVLNHSQLTLLLEQLRGDLLYDLLAAHRLRRSGPKAERIERLVRCPLSERTLLSDLRRTDLTELCKKLRIAISGVKEEIVDRLINWASFMSQQPVVALAERGGETEAATPAGPPANHVAPPSESGHRVMERSQEERAAAPAGLSEIRERFGELEDDQQVILALLREAKSLTELEIERAAHNHGLSWFLTKAHMADLLAQLRQQGKNVLRVRGTGSANVYEWSRAADDHENGLERSAARDVIDALRQGVVPQRHLDLLAVGQDEARSHLTELFEHVEKGRSEFKFVRGAYGAGKTFLCSWLCERAFEHDFAISAVRIGPDQPLSDLPVFFSCLIDGLRTPEKRDGSALADILESWLLAVHQRTARLDAPAATGLEGERDLRSLVEVRIGEKLAQLADIDPGIAPALRAFYKARVEGNHDTAANALTWFRGSRLLAASALRSIGVRGQLTADEVFPRMRALLQVIAEGRLRGLVLVVDEIELVRRFPHARQREQAYETLRLLIDECGTNNLPGCLLICTGTDQLFEDERYGIKSYQALADRVENPRGTEGPASVRQPILLLDPLDSERLLEVAERVRDIHGSAYDWPAEERVPTAVLERVAREWTAFGAEEVGRLPREFLRNVVNLLDLCEERQDVPAESFLLEPSTLRDSASSVLALLQK